MKGLYSVENNCQLSQGVVELEDLSVESRTRTVQQTIDLDEEVNVGRIPEGLQP